MTTLLMVFGLLAAFCLTATFGLFIGALMAAARDDEWHELDQQRRNAARLRLVLGDDERGAS